MKGGERMKNVKYVVITAIMMLLLFLIPNISKATVEYTRTIPGNDGSIILNLTGLTLDENKNYSFTLLKGKGDLSSATWNNLIDFTSSTAKVTLSSGTKAIVDVLKVTDKGYLYIKNNDDNSYVVEAKEIDLKLPYLQAINYKYDKSYDIYNTYGIKDRVYIQFKKVSDRTLIQKYVEIKTKNGDVSSLSNYIGNVPTTGYGSTTNMSYGGWISQKDVEKNNDGLYLLWVKITGENCKDIYGCIVHDGLPKATKVADYINGEGPKVTKIQVESPKSGTYKTKQTVKIRVYFDKKITGTKVPTLKIKFGSSAERSVTNGTIHNDATVRSSGQYIEYSYNIQSGDNGQLATVSLTGGTIKDEDGNAAILSCPVLSGSITIKANTKGTVTNNTENQDKTNNTSNNTNKNSNSSSNKSGDKDETTAKGKIPYTGASLTVVFAIGIILVIGIVAKTQYNKYRDI